MITNEIGLDTQHVILRRKVHCGVLTARTTSMVRNSSQASGEDD